MTKTIYIVDDDDAVRASLHSLLSVRSDLVIRSYRSGDAFLGEAKELDAGVLLLDFHMPGSTGLDVLNALGDGGAFVPIILTGQGNVTLAVQALGPDRVAPGVHLIAPNYVAVGSVSAPRILSAAE